MMWVLNTAASIILAFKFKKYLPQQTQAKVNYEKRILCKYKQNLLTIFNELNSKKEVSKGFQT